LEKEEKSTRGCGTYLLPVTCSDLGGGGLFGITPSSGKSGGQTTPAANPLKEGEIHLVSQG